jgi:hypothetical protein
MWEIQHLFLVSNIVSWRIIDPEFLWEFGGSYRFSFQKNVHHKFWLSLTFALGLCFQQSQALHGLQMKSLLSKKRNYIFWDPSIFIFMPNKINPRWYFFFKLKLTWGQGGEMNQALYAHMNNKRKMEKKKNLQHQARKIMWLFLQILESGSQRKSPTFLHGKVRPLELPNPPYLRRIVNQQRQKYCH